MVYVRCFWQGNHQLYGHIRCVCTCHAIYMQGSGRGVRGMYAEIRVWVRGMHHILHMLRNHMWMLGKYAEIRAWVRGMYAEVRMWMHGIFVKR